MHVNKNFTSKAGVGTPHVIDTIDLTLSDSDEEGVLIVDPPPLYELVYKEKSEALVKALKDLKNKNHSAYTEGLEKLKLDKKNEQEKNNMKMEREREAVEREYVKTCQLIKEETEKQRQEIIETLISELNEKKKTILTQKHLMELESDSTDEIPLTTRKLRKRPYDLVVSVPQEKRRKLPPLTSNYYLLQENEIQEDVKAIQETLDSKVSTSKSDLHQSSSIDIHSPKSNGSEATISNLRIESGKLLYDKRWYHRGQTIFVEEIPMEKFPAIISSIGKEMIWVKKTLDNSKFRINLSCLSNGKITITRRAAL